MTLITRYVLAELLKVFLITLLGMTIFMVLVLLVGQAVREGLGALAIVQLVPYVLPNALRFSVPGTILFAACSVYGRMSAYNEVVAIKSQGISPVTLLRPAWALAFVVSLIAVWLNDVAVSWGAMGIRRVILQSVEQIAYGMLRTHKTYSPTDQLTINVQSVEGQRLIRPTISMHGSDSSPGLTVTADEAQLRYDSESDELTVFLTNSEAYDFSGQVHLWLPKVRRQIPLSLASDTDKQVSPSNCRSSEIPAETERQRQVVKQMEQQRAAEAAYVMMSGSVDRLDALPWQERLNELAYARSRLFRLQTEPWRRWANGFSCLFFVMVGAPLAMRMRNSDLFTTFGTCFLPILLLYYPLLMLGVDRAKAGELPPYSVWLGNVILSSVGLWLIRRVCRY